MGEMPVGRVAQRAPAPGHRLEKSGFVVLRLGMVVARKSRVRDAFDVFHFALQSGTIRLVMLNARQSVSQKQKETIKIQFDPGPAAALVLVPGSTAKSIGAKTSRTSETQS